MAGVDVDAARALLRDDLGRLDPALPAIRDALVAAGAAECWHKHSSFLDHLLGTHRIAALWGLPRDVRLCALLHSAFSNSFVNLALWPPDGAGRSAVRALAGEGAEEWTWLFCRVPRHELVYARLVDPIVYGGVGGGAGAGDGAGAVAGQTAEAGAAAAAPAAAAASPAAAPAAAASPPPPPDYAPAFPSSVTVVDIRDGSAIELDAYQLGLLLALTILDFSEQLHSWQDGMLATAEDGSVGNGGGGGSVGGGAVGGGGSVGGRLRYAGKRAHHLWPGQGKPGLYLHTLSEMGRLVVAANARLEADGDARRVPLPRPWRACSEVVSREAQRDGRDLYWRVVTELSEAGADGFADREEEDFWGAGGKKETPEGWAARRARGEEREREAEEALRACAALLPCVAEPRIVLSQLLLQRAVRLTQQVQQERAGTTSPGDGGGDGDDATAATTTTTTIRECWREAGELAIEGLSLLLAWGTPWDKRFPWLAWCAWARVCCEGARKKDWPRNDEPMRVINLGLVR